ncbi:unnamed protein product [Leptidea sinapis]|uniref:WW domain-containing protein n=1 Tax=Leptidea sinapis TaxID=189913 RepID=A0A5E4Q8E3_9NEOP|nr:unnamed protein product [Leptidea sinapis]
MYLFIHFLPFIFSHITKTTTWEDPRKTLAAQTVASGVQHQSAETLLTQTAPAHNIAATTTAPKNTSSNSTSDPLGPLPEAQHLQRTPAASAGVAGGGWANASVQACQQKLRLQRIKCK